MKAKTVTQSAAGVADLIEVVRPDGSKLLARVEAVVPVFEPGYYVTTNNVGRDGSVSPGAILMLQFESGEWLCLSPNTYQDPQEQMASWRRSNGVTRVKLVTA